MKTYNSAIITLLTDLDDLERMYEITEEYQYKKASSFFSGYINPDNTMKMVLLCFLLIALAFIFLTFTNGLSFVGAVFVAVSSHTYIKQQEKKLVSKQCKSRLCTYYQDLSKHTNLTNIMNRGESISNNFDNILRLQIHDIKEQLENLGYYDVARTFSKISLYITAPDINLLRRSLRRQLHINLSTQQFLRDNQRPSEIMIRTSQKNLGARITKDLGEEKHNPQAVRFIKGK